MKNVAVLLLSCACSTVCWAISYDDDGNYLRINDYLRNPLPLIMNQGRKLDYGSISRQWLKDYDHSSSHELGPHFTRTSTLSPEHQEELEWLMNDVINQQEQPADAERLPYPSRVLDLSRLQLQKDDGEFDTDIGYHDLFGTTPSMPESLANDYAFHDALRNYLNHQQKDEQILRLPQMGLDYPKISSKAMKGAMEGLLPPTGKHVKDNKLSAPKTAVTTSAPEQSQKNVFSSDADSDTHTAMPPVSIGKGQKEYAMLRPASDNNRKFDSWAESFQKSAAASANGGNQQRVWALRSEVPKDSLAKELDKLKTPNNQHNKPATKTY